MNATDRAEFPQASLVVRVGDAGWSSEDDDLLEQLSAIMQRRVRQQKPQTLETLSALLEPPPRVRLNKNACLCIVRASDDFRRRRKPKFQQTFAAWSSKKLRESIGRAILC